MRLLDEEDADEDDDDLDDTPPAVPAKLSLTEQDKKDFQLQRALAVLRYGSVATAVQMSPTALYTKPAPKFTTTRAEPQPAPAGLHTDAGATVKGPAAAPAPADKVAPSQAAPAVSVPPKQP